MTEGMKAMPEEFSVSFHTSDELLQRVYDAAEQKCLDNLRYFGKELVLVEGGGYNKIWLETQPMGGEMYSLRNPEAAMNNCLLFMRCQREDGRLPGSIQCVNGFVEPQFDKYQGFCFPYPALNLYYTLGRNREYLQQLKDCLIRFDECLHRTRELKKDGLLYSFCVYDTGEDKAVRYGDAPCWWTLDVPPKGYSVVPMASMDVTSWSYACRDIVANICQIQGDEAAEKWREKADSVAAALRRGLWDERRGALYDRDHEGKTIDILCHNTLRCMYWGSISQTMADRFVRDHLMNPAEFWTPFPLPSVAVNDPAFRNAPENNWSGQPEGLTYQRAILALENYGYHTLVTKLGEKLISTVSKNSCRFTQQFDPFTADASLIHAVTHQPVIDQSDPVQDNYGPTMLAVLEYIAHHYGISLRLGEVWWSLGTGERYEYDVHCSSRHYTIKSNGQQAELQLNGTTIEKSLCGIRIVTDESGNIKRKYRIEL